MTTTSLKLPDELKAQAAEVARSQGVSVHAFMVDAIRMATLAAEQRARFVAEAKVARKAMLKSGTGYDADVVHAYLRQRATGKTATAPKVQSWRG